MNEYLKRLQREADTVLTALDGLKDNENYDKLKNAVKVIMTQLIEKVGE